MWIHKIQNEQLSLYAPFIKIFYPKQLSYSARPLSCHGSYRLLEGLKLCGKSVGEVPLFLSQSFMECIFLTWHACIYTTKIYAVHLQIYIIHVLMISVQVFAICQVLSPFLRSQKKHVVIKNDKDKANVKPPPPPAWAVHPAAATLCPNLSYQTKRGTTVACHPTQVIYWLKTTHIWKNEELNEFKLRANASAAIPATAVLRSLHTSYWFGKPQHHLAVSTK